MCHSIFRQMSKCNNLTENALAHTVMPKGLYREKAKMAAVIGGLLVLIAALAWSTAGLFTRVVSTDIPTTLFGRSLSGGVCVLLIYAVASRRAERDIWKFSTGEVVVAILSAAGMICFISAFFYTTIANVTFLYGLMPLVTLLLSAIVLKQSPTRIGVMCCIVAAFGVAIIFWTEKNLSDWLGFILALGMTFFMSALTVATKFYPKADVTKATYLSALVAAVIVLPFSSISSITPTDGLWLAAYGVVNVGLGFGVYLLGVTRISALAAALIGLVEIPLAPVWAYLFFDERIVASALLGGGIVLAAAATYILSNKNT